MVREVQSVLHEPAQDVLIAPQAWEWGQRDLNASLCNAALLLHFLHTVYLFSVMCRALVKSKVLQQMLTACHYGVACTTCAA